MTDGPQIPDLVIDLNQEETPEVQEQEVVETPQEQEITRIKVGEQEYTQDELNELVGLGSRAREVGSAHGGFDKFVSEYGRKSERIGELKKQLDEKAKPVEGDPEDQIEQAKLAAKRLGIVLKEDLESYSENYYTNRRAGEKLLESCSSLESEIDGTDGRPKFETQKVLDFMNINAGYTDPKRAYEAMNLDVISDWKAERINKSRSKGITTITNTSGQKMPSEVKVTKDNLQSLISEAMSS